MDVKQPKVSIILVNYNGYKDTMDCINSLRAITYRNYEVIVIDNASKDQSVAILNDFLQDGEILISSKENGGFSAGNNIGIKYALEHDADYCLLLNNDTVVEADFLDRLVEGYEFSIKCGLTIGKILYESMRDTIWYAGGSLSKRTARVEHWDYQNKDTNMNTHMQKVTFATGCCMCLSRKTVEAVGLMDESYFLYEEDADYCKRINDAGFDMVYVPLARIYHKVSASTGKTSKAAQIYSLRNRYLFVRKRYHGTNKILAYTFITLQTLARVIKGKQDFNCSLLALGLFFREKYGAVL